MNNRSCAVTPSSPLGASIFHLAIDSSGKSVWGSGIPGSPIANLSLDPFNSSSSTLGISGDKSAITGLAFLGGTTYYPSSGAGGFGAFGTIDLTTGVATQIASPVPAAHGISTDLFTGSLILFGDDTVSQYKPGSGSISSATRWMMSRRYPASDRAIRSFRNPRPRCSSALAD